MAREQARNHASTRISQSLSIKDWTDIGLAESVPLHALQKETNRRCVRDALLQLHLQLGTGTLHVARTTGEDASDASTPILELLAF